ncbi:hypothetical protein BpHYR1_014401 [Brachionus plicatilis]|uniref:Uncharacterized protein n=1 Tax=Brachionus plicatilis TaxID=10195 RepID=A0A3M7R2H5_BRAPC|nr:hypothetical protein BpHYR1_014401 [Brachionus plicatilis]
MYSLSNFRFHHCCQLSLDNFKEMAMNIPLERKRRPGRPKARTNALILQPNEAQVVDDIGEESDSESIVNK